MSIYKYGITPSSIKAEKELTKAEKERIVNGLQCPECYGIQIKFNQVRFGTQNEGKFECQECGCNWSKMYYKN